ncbi:MAG: hypothetical protein LUG56_01800 [Lachnospiraceae bacterium]|nr:hypothetical protein [Lachnospiraceae bacterium]
MPYNEAALNVNHKRDSNESVNSLRRCRNAEEEKEATIERMLKDGSLAIDKIASFVSVPVQRVREIEAGLLQET